MAMTENPKLDFVSSYDGGGSEERISTQKNSGSDHINGDNKPDSFVIDIESFSHGGSNIKETIPNSRITRSLSRKGSQRGDRDSFVSNSSSSSGGLPEKLMVVAEEFTDHLSNPQVHHQLISMTSGNSITAATESRSNLRRNSIKRSPLLDPKRILMFFATLACVQDPQASFDHSLKTSSIQMSACLQVTSITLKTLAFHRQFPLSNSYNPIKSSIKGLYRQELINTNVCSSRGFLTRTIQSNHPYVCRSLVLFWPIKRTSIPSLGYVYDMVNFLSSFRHT
ncbi:hypothetical protein ES332_A10G017400v1 [Gossypium tomentosum]|uniref:Uncharacterized protein n=1 Tax=Gossypium tomentosum TaxID=34277 RepID=A0A5D2NKM2_GOSTO|nr:hypothetical protein ES332_A10G017400v1 [Gossypium tomentosum]